MRIHIYIDREGWLQFPDKAIPGYEYVFDGAGKVLPTTPFKPETSIEVAVVPVKLMEEMIEAYGEYVRLLNDELNEVVGLAHAHGWKSTRVEDGRRCRSKIDALLSQAREVMK